MSGRRPDSPAPAPSELRFVRYYWIGLAVYFAAIASMFRSRAGYVFLVEFDLIPFSLAYTRYLGLVAVYCVAFALFCYWACCRDFNKRAR